MIDSDLCWKLHSSEVARIKEQLEKSYKIIKNTW